eukprot:SAG11_NODE_11848_length_734_cov_1.077044_2_plen_36_part_01
MGYHTFACGINRRDDAHNDKVSLFETPLMPDLPSFC